LIPGIQRRSRQRNPQRRRRWRTPSWYLQGESRPLPDRLVSLLTNWRQMSSINSASNHQPVLVAVAQHGSLDDAVYFVSRLYMSLLDPRAHVLVADRWRCWSRRCCWGGRSCCWGSRRSCPGWRSWSGWRSCSSWRRRYVQLSQVLECILNSPFTGAANTGNNAGGGQGQGQGKGQGAGAFGGRGGNAQAPGALNVVTTSTVTAQGCAATSLLRKRLASLDELN
jgi:hypothetical protein